MITDQNPVALHGMISRLSLEPIIFDNYYQIFIFVKKRNTQGESGEDLKP